MVSRRELKLLLPRPVRRFPADLTVVVGLVAAALLAVWLPVVRESWLRAVLGGVFVLFVPGYAVVAALFPESSESGTDESEPADDRGPTAHWPRSSAGLTLAERGLFSVGASLLVVPLLALVINFAPVDITRESLLFSVGGFALAMAAVAAARRWRLPAERRFRVPYGEWAAGISAERLAGSSTLDTALNVVLVVSVLVAVGGGVYAVLGPQESQTFTEFYLLGENETGELAADGYPETIARGENATVVVGIGNHEHRDVEYSVVVQLQQVRETNDSSTVTDSRELDRFRAAVGDNETVHRRHEFAPGTTGERLRLQYLLYVDEPPEDPSAGNAYRSVHVWVNVTEQ
ncbi:DUF1616 domain-containing protein (plasmid) [Halorussus salilacus]|uniref:DUF1616 domain-containing protein n=1 Tax=Halorussus salilacus TaxID=2953750 RepID=UPI0020A16849|nr:DUF1616 domain-containing protein [Halorussus salilacus]USZ69752.1 DUF1616 domain-containing protein [Halorussus salilacus]